MPSRRRSWLYRLLDHPSADLGTVRFLAYGSAPIAPARLRQALDRLGPVLTQTYATTEAPAIAMLDAADHAAAMGERPELLGSVGRPLPGVSVEVRAAGAPVPVGEVGEVCVRGASVTLASVTFVDALPLTALGKPDKAALRARL